jgi:hypothetical protein
MHDNDVPNLFEAIGELMPGAAEPRVDAARCFRMSMSASSI